MKKVIIIILVLLSLKSFAQENKKSNSIFFIEISSGGSFGNGGGGNASILTNFQIEKHVFTYKYSGTFKISSEDNLLIALIPFSYVFLPVKLEERALMYGKRYVKNDFSYSFSGGLSYTDYQGNFVDNEATHFGDFIGFPFEINIRWFNAEKSKFHFLGIIPIGEANGFSAASGLKLFGSISEKPYIGIGLSIGIGYYKNYN